jgi:uncharacterized cofD-like protein
MMQKKRIVTIGGGTGTHTVLRGLKRYQDKIDLTAIVTMADSGGSTGRLRDEFGYLPVGDVRMALAALASDIDEHEELVRELFLHRFAKGEGLNGHNVGNLLLVALTDILGSEEQAIATASKLLRVQGRVLPVSTESVDLVATYSDGVVVTGEHAIDEPKSDRLPHRITDLSVTPQAAANPRAAIAISEADLVVLGPGDLYTSLLANVVVSGIDTALADTTARLVYVCNLMTKSGQTSGMGVAEHVAEIKRYIGRVPDVVLVNVTSLPQDLIQTYAAGSEFPVRFNCESHESRVIPDDLLASEVVTTKAGDTLKRSLIRHDSEKLAQKLVSLL